MSAWAAEGDDSLGGVDRRCDAFEDAWQQGQRPRIEDYLGDASGEERDALLRWLIPLDVKYRRQYEETPHLRYYLSLSPSLPVDWLIGVIRAGGTLADRYDVGAEIGGGGTAAVHLGQDRWLKRAVAVKVLRQQYQHHPEMVRRFENEARITSRLQHPGIVPIHDLGESSDRRPCITMKLVDGHTLAKLLEQRAVPSQDLPRFLTIFEQICQTLAYAHAQGVIHRDLKPHNVMVGAFGEVQLMDWGFAKELRQAKSNESVALSGAETTVVARIEDTVAEGTGTQFGQVFGSLPYMPPEQARGEVERVDERSDVFGLGAILCEILTGRPPFTGSEGKDVLAKARKCDHAEAMARLDACGADAELLHLAKACLAAEPDARPRNAGVVAEEVKAYLAGLQELLEKAERERAAAEARAQEARRTVAVETSKRRLMVWAAMVVLLVTTAGFAATYWQYRDAVDQRDHARDQETEVRRQLAHNRLALFNSQLLRVGLLWERDPFQGLQLLTDTDTCPPDLRDFTWGMYYRLCQRKRLTIQAASGEENIYSLAITSDGRMIASGGALWGGEPNEVVAGVTKLWDAVSGREVANLPGHTKAVSGLAFSSDGSLLASGGDDGTVIVWDVANRKPLAKFQDRPVNGNKRLQFTADKRLLFVWYEMGVAPPKLWDLATKTECALPLTEGAWVYSISPDGKLLAGGGFPDDTDRLLDLTKCREIHRLKHTHGGSMALAFSPDSRILASGGGEHVGTIELWDVATGKNLKHLWDGLDDLYYLTFTTDGTGLFAVGNGSAKLWNIASAEVKLCVPAIDGFCSSALSADGKTLVGIPDKQRTSQAFTVWDLNRRPMAFHSEDYLDTREDPLCSNGTILALVSYESESLQCWNLTSGAKQKLVWGEGGALGDAALTPDGHILMTVGEDNAIRAWELPSGKQRSVLSLPPQTGSYQCPAISPNGRRLAVLRHMVDGSNPPGQRQKIWEVTVWDVAAERPCFAVKGAFPIESDTIESFFLTFSPDGTMLAGKTSPLIVQIWDIEKGTELASLPVKKGEGKAGAFRPDGKMLALSCGRTIRLWDLAKNRESGCLRGHTRQVCSLSFSPDGRTLATGSADRTVRLWDVACGLEQAALVGYKGGVGCVAFSMDGRRLVAADGAGTVRVYEAAFPAPVGE
jgi:WD40 repeat protein/tRNA A-37 threonylcarbamoyl transferase component Bud32